MPCGGLAPIEDEQASRLRPPEPGPQTTGLELGEPAGDALAGAPRLERAGEQAKHHDGSSAFGSASKVGRGSVMARG